MNEGIYLRCNPHEGWSVDVRDSNYVILRTLVGPGVATMEEAMRQFAMLSGNSVFISLTDPQLGQIRSDLYPISLTPKR